MGAGIVTGVAYVGVTSSSDEPDDLTALGDVVNTASRLAGAAAAGEILASRLTIAAAGVDETGLERRMLALGQGRAIRGVPDSAVNTMMSTVSGWAAT
ncbi:MAG: hypothetical protein ABI744_00025 [Chloroflexota bacterium]